MAVFSSMMGVVCKGAMALGSGCGRCERCVSEIAAMEPLKAPKPAKPTGVMDHRDVIDAARKHVATGGHVKFLLPVGAFLGGLYHLGGGVFVAKLPVEQSMAHHKGRFAEPPDLLGLFGDRALLDAAPKVVPLELCDNPLPSSLAAGEYRRVVPTQLTVKMLEPSSGAQVWRSVETGKVVRRRGPKR